MKPEREKVRQVALEMIRADGLINLARNELCQAAQIPDGSFPHVMGCNFNEFIDELKLENINTQPINVNKSRVNPVLRQEHILNVALELSEEFGYQKVTRSQIAEKAGISMGLVTRYFGTMSQLRRAIMRAAVQRSILKIIAQGLANNDNQATKASHELKTQAANLIAHC